MNTFQKYSKPFLRQKLTSTFYDSVPYHQLDYLDAYLTELKCEWVCIEEEYIDALYTDEYIHFYSACFEKYDKYTKRIHFFQKASEREASKRVTPEEEDQEISADDIPQIVSDLYKNHLNAESHAILNRAYLGFIVIKPLPEKTLGRIILKPLEQLFPLSIIKRKYDINLNGIPLQIESIALQPQDPVLSICATISLWVMFQIMAKKFDKYLPSPYEITSIASEVKEEVQFKKKGFSTKETAAVIRHYGFDLDLCNSKASFELLNFCYAYLSAGFPVLLSLKFNDSYHQITLTGYELAPISDISQKIQQNDSNSPTNPPANPPVNPPTNPPVNPPVNPPTNPPVNSPTNPSANPPTNPPANPPAIKFKELYGAHITSFFAHDDNIGPYVKYNVKIDQNNSLLLESNHRTQDKRPIACSIRHCMVALYRKIRISVSDFYILTMEFHEFLKPFIQAKYPTGHILIDTNLILSNSYKVQLLEASANTIANPSNLLMSNLPKYIWRIRMFLCHSLTNNASTDAQSDTCNFHHPICDLIIDTTQTYKSFYFKKIVFFTEFNEVFNQIEQYLKEKRSNLALKHPRWNQFLTEELNARGNQIPTVKLEENID